MSREGKSFGGFPGRDDEKNQEKRKNNKQDTLQNRNHHNAYEREHIGTGSQAYLGRHVPSAHTSSVKERTALKHEMDEIWERDLHGYHLENIRENIPEESSFLYTKESHAPRKGH